MYISAKFSHEVIENIYGVWPREMEKHAHLCVVLFTTQFMII